MYQSIKNLVGVFLGYSSCDGCGRTFWKQKTHTYIPYYNENQIVRYPGKDGYYYLVTGGRIRCSVCQPEDAMPPRITDPELIKKLDEQWGRRAKTQ